MPTTFTSHAKIKCLTKNPCHSGWTRTTDLVPVDTRYNAPCDGMAERVLPTELLNELPRIALPISFKEDIPHG